MTNSATNSATNPATNPARFIRDNLKVAAVPLVPEIRLYTAHCRSGLSQLTGDAAPYWAYPWAGGLALARYVLDHPECVRGLRVLDLGAGSGVAGIAAARAGAASVICAEIDPYGIAAIGLNAALNGVAVKCCGDDLTRGGAPEVAVVLAGDVFYAAAVARKVTRFLHRCAMSGAAVLVGDPGRAHLPQARLHLVAEYPLRDFGDAPAALPGSGKVFAYRPGA